MAYFNHFQISKNLDLVYIASSTAYRNHFSLYFCCFDIKLCELLVERVVEETIEIFYIKKSKR